MQNEGISVKKMSPNTLMIVNLLSPDGRYDSTFLSNYATIYIKDELGRLPGVAGITYLGQRDYSLRAWLDPAKLAALNLSATDVVTAISQQNLQVAAGQIGQQPVPRGQQFQLTINTLGRLVEPEQFGDIILKAGGQIQTGAWMPAVGGHRRRQRLQGEPDDGGLPGRRDRRGRVQQPGRRACRRPPASSGCATWPGSSWARGSTTSPAPSTASRRWRSRSTSCPAPMRSRPPSGVYAKMRELKGRFPDGLDYKIVYDTTPFIQRVGQRGLQDPARRGDPGRHRRAGLPAGLEGHDPADDRRAGLADRHVRRSWRRMGFSLNNLTLFGLVLAIGIVVDDAIVVLENIERLIATGLDSRTATIKAMEEITGPILAITLVLSSVFIPCCFLGGITGQFFRQFAVTIAVSTIISAINALTMTPSRAVHDLQDRGRGPRRSRAQARGAAVVDLRDGGRDAQRSGWARMSSPAGMACRRRRTRPRAPQISDWMSCAASCAAYFAAGAIVGGLIRPGVHPAGQRRAGLAVPRLQPALRPDDRRLRPDRRRRCCGSARSC